MHENDRFIVDSSLLPHVPEGYEIDEQVTDTDYLRLGEDELVLLEPTEEDLRGGTSLADAIQRIPRDEMLNATDAWMLVLNHRFIPKAWQQTQTILFPGTRFKDAHGRILLACLRWCVPIDGMSGLPTGHDSWVFDHFPLDCEWIEPMRYLAIAKRSPR